MELFDTISSSIAIILGSIVIVLLFTCSFSFLLKKLFNIEPKKRLIYSLILSYVLIVGCSILGSDESIWFEILISTIGMWIILKDDYEKETVEWRSKGK